MNKNLFFILLCVCMSVCVCTLLVYFWMSFPKSNSSIRIQEKTSYDNTLAVYDGIVCMFKTKDERQRTENEKNLSKIYKIGDRDIRIIDIRNYEILLKTI